MLQKDIPDPTQFFSYIEVGESRSMSSVAQWGGSTGGYLSKQLFNVYDDIVKSNANMIKERVQKVSDVYPTFRKIFAKDKKET